MPITEAKIKGAKPKDSDYLIYDGGRNGLALRIGRGGTKTWFYRFRLDGKGKKIKLGIYPWMSIRDAQAAALEAAKQVAEGVDPRAKKKSDAREAKNAELTFRECAEEWFVTRYKDRALRTVETVQGTLDRDILPWLGNRPMVSLDAADLWEVIDRVQKRGASHVASRIRGYFNQIFKLAIRRRVVKHNVAADLGNIEHAKPRHFAALTAPTDVGGLIRAIRKYEGTFVVKCALELAPLFFVRPGEELRKALWTEFDFDERLWFIPSSRDKMRRGHIVPLSAQAVKILKTLHPLTGDGEHVFSGRDGIRPIGKNTINGALERLDFKGVMTGHGFRAMARTLLRERLHFDRDVIEKQLAHEKGGVEGAYDRAEYMQQRVDMMQKWADYLDELANGANVNVIPFERRLALVN